MVWHHCGRMVHMVIRLCDSVCGLPVVSQHLKVVQDGITVGMSWPFMGHISSDFSSHTAVTDMVKGVWFLDSIDVV